MSVKQDECNSAGSSQAFQAPGLDPVCCRLHVNHVWMPICAFYVHFNKQHNSEASQYQTSGNTEQLAVIVLVQKHGEKQVYFTAVHLYFFQVNVSFTLM